MVLVTSVENGAGACGGAASAATGHRRRLLNAIAAIKADVGLKSVGQSVGPLATAQAEQRQLTVVFADLVGSTALSTRFDPEDLREIVGAYHRCVADTVGRFGGFPPSQHLTGPWQLIRRWQTDNAQTLRRDSAAPGR